MFILIGQDLEGERWEVLGGRDTKKDAVKQAQHLVDINNYFEVKVVKEVDSRVQVEES